MAKHKLDAKTFAKQKRKRRQWLTFVRMCRYGVNNFSRNAWLTVAATAVMTITLLIILMTFLAQNVLSDSVKQISDKVDMSIYLKNDVKTEVVTKIAKELRSLSNVRQVSYISVDDARANFAEKNKADSSTLEALNKASNRFPATLRVKLIDINDTSQLDTFVKQNKDYQANKDAAREPSFAGQRREAIQTLGRATEFAQTFGIIASVIFVVISSLIVFNTIRMAIFNRKEEIQMMKLIGADSSFIRGPFVVEAIVYGFIAAVIATGLSVGILFSMTDRLKSYGVAVQPTTELVTTYIAFVLLAMILIGAIIGVGSSLMATRKYLKV